MLVSGDAASMPTANILDQLGLDLSSLDLSFPTEDPVTVMLLAGGVALVIYLLIRLIRR
jgi:hypothetical protein